MLEAPPRRPSVEFIITLQCLLRCPYCYGKSRFGPSGRHVPSETVRAWIDRILGCPQLRYAIPVMIGGEPLCHPNIRGLVEHVLALQTELGVEGRVHLVTSAAFAGVNEPAVEWLLTKSEVSWELSYHGRSNHAHYGRLLHRLLEAPEKRRVVRSKIVFPDKDCALRLAAGVESVVEEIHPGAFAAATGGIRKLRRRIERLASRQDQSTTMLDMKLGKSRFFLYFQKAGHLGKIAIEGEPCSALEATITGLVVDERGALVPCQTPFQRIARPLLQEPLEDVDDLADRLEPSLAEHRRLLVEKAMSAGASSPAELRAALSVGRACLYCRDLAAEMPGPFRLAPAQPERISPAAGSREE